jgi:hypothetical protein
MNAAPKKSAIVLLCVTIFAAISINAIRIVYPPSRAVNSAKISQLQREQQELSRYNSDNLRVIEQRVSDLKRQLWTDSAFAVWKKNNLPDGWVAQELSPADAKEVRARRFAIQRHNATSQQWDEILNVLRATESNRCINVQTVSLGTRGGYAGSRQFSQCTIFATFFFSTSDFKP